METEINVEELFQYAPYIQLPICRKCDHAVWPDRIARHVRRRPHRLSRHDADYVQRAIQQWPNLLEDRSTILTIHQTIQPQIPELPSYSNGLLCEGEPGICRYVCRDDSAMKSHFARCHPGRRGKSGARCASRQNKKNAQPWRGVCCQRIFPSRQGSQYFEVEAPPVQDETPAPVPPPPPPGKIEQARQMLESRMDKIKDRERCIIEEGSYREPSPWLIRTGWQKYLRKLDRDELLESVATPDANNEAVGHVIWEAMAEMMRRCQSTTDEHAGVFVRKEVMRTEEDQSRFVPLKGYQNPDEIRDKGRHWQQIVMFFVRTQQPHEWKSPRYRFNVHQRRAFRRLMRAAREEVEGGEWKESTGEVGSQEEGAENVDSDGETDAGTSEDGEPWGTHAVIALDGVRRACLEFCIALLCGKARQHEYEHALVCALAVLGVDRDGWKGYGSYPPILSSMIKIGRFMVIQHAFHESHGNHPPPAPRVPCSDDGSVSEEASDEENATSGCIDVVKRMVDESMLRTSHGPMEWMLDLRTYGMKIQFSSTAPGYIDWQGDQVRYKDVQFTMPQFRGMVHQLMHDVRERMIRRVLDVGAHDERQLPRIPWDHLRDDPANAQPGWNYVQDRRNPWPVDGRWWLFHRLMKSAQYQLLHDGPQARWNAEEAQSWMKEEDAVREGMLLLMHLAGGQPGRGPEVLSIRHSNTSGGGYRNIGIENGQVFVAVRYHKGYSMSGDVKIIHRYLPREVGELFVWWMWLVLPFRQRIEAEVYHRSSRSSFIWPAASASGHKFRSDRLREALKRAGMVYMGTSLNIQSYRHVVIAISRRYLRGKHAFRHDDEDERGDVDEDVDNIIDEQAGHISHIAWSIYARAISERDGEVAHMRTRFREASQMWHRFLGFASGWERRDWKETSTRAAPFEGEALAARMHRWQQLRRTHIETALQKMMGPHYRFRGVQREAIAAVMRGEPRVVAIMGTGGGKSLIFMLPAWCGMGMGGTTVVVVPLIALRQDMVRRCRELGLECVEWSPSRVADGADIVLVTPEAWFTVAFGKFMQRTKAAQQLDMIVVDECHVAFNRQKHFRPRLQQLGDVNRWEVPVLMLTATMPVQMEDEFRRRMGIHEVPVSIFRAATTRHNIRYGIRRLTAARRGNSQRQQHPVNEGRDQGGGGGDSTWLEGVVEYVRQRQQQHAGGKLVVYCQSVPQTKQLAELLGCDAYHHHAVDKQAKMQAFQEGHRTVMVSTSAFGMGVDISDIRVIIHVDEPRSLLDYAQESGRAGRDGQTSEAIIALPPQASPRRPPWWQNKQDRTKDETARQMVWAYMEARCHRVVMDRFMDGNETRDGCGSGEEACQPCRSRVGWERRMEEEPTMVPQEDQSSPGGEVGPDRRHHEGIGASSDDSCTENSTSSTSSDSESDDGNDDDGADAGRENSEKEVIPRSKRGADETWWDRHMFDRQQIQQRQIGRAWQKTKQENRRRMEEVHDWLQQAQGKCVFCFVQGRIGKAHRSIYDCDATEAADAQALYRMIKNGIRESKAMSDFTGCSFCFVPQAWCRSWRRKSNEADGEYERVYQGSSEGFHCQFKDVVIGTLATAVVFTGTGRESYVDGLDQRIQRRGGEGVEAPGNLREFLAQAADGGGLETSQMMQECWYAWQHLQQFSQGFDRAARIDDGRYSYIVASM